MNATQATIWFISTAVILLVLVGGGILMAANVLHMPHLHMPHLRHRHPH